jgi:enoyl-CoA hydratase/carnithine racemase
VVVLAAEGRGFCAGHDLKEMRTHAGGRRRPQHRPKARDGAAAQQCTHRRMHRARVSLVNRVVPMAALDVEVRQLTDQIVSRSAATIRLGKAAFYQQIERPLAAAYDVASKTMTCNMSLNDAAEGIAAFLQKRPPTWRDW